MIQVQDLTYYYRGQDTPTLQNLNCRFEPGKISAVVGANGRGKSTLANILAGLVKLKKPSSGTVDLGGASVGIVFQNPSVQVLFDTVHEEIAFVLENHHIAPEFHAQRIAEALEKVGLTGQERENPLHFSLGMKQRLAIATVLALNPDFIIFDEATAMLDARAKLTMLNIYRDLARIGTGVVMVTNIIDELLIADSTLVLLDDRSHQQLERPVRANVQEVAALLECAGFDLSPLWQLCRIASADASEYAPNAYTDESRMQNADSTNGAAPSSEVIATAQKALEMLHTPLLEGFF